MKLYLTLAALFLLATEGFTQTGTISGTITEQPNGQPIIGAVVIVDSLRPVKGAVSDFDGKYTLKLAPGVYSLSCRYTGFSPVTITGVTVAPGKTTSLDFSLSVTLDSVIIIYATRPTRSTSAVLDTIHHGNSVAVGKSGDEIRETPATDAGQVARTLPGVTLVDNRFVIVRGLSERYNAVLLNNVLAPSVESDVKAFSFDLIPSAMIDNFMIYKSASPDLPGEFAGGVIRVNTTEIPDNNGLQVNYQAGYRNGTTFQPFSINGGTTADFFAYGSKSRELPDGFPVNLRPLMASGDAQALQDAGRSLSADWGYKSRNAPADIRFNSTWNYRYSKPGGNGKTGFQFGNITGLSYSNAYSAFTSYRLDYNVYDTINDRSDTLFSYEDAVYRQAVRVAFVQNNTVRFGKAGNQRITLKNLFNQMGDNETILRTGKNMDESNYRQEYSYRYTQRSIYTAQLGGLHLFNNKNTQLDWTAAYSLSRRSDPDWKKARYTKDFSAAPNDPFTLYVPANPSPTFLGRIFIGMEEDIVAGSANLNQSITLGADSASKKAGYTFSVKTGIYVEQKQRYFSIRNLGYVAATSSTYGNTELLQTPINQVFVNENINAASGLEIGEDTKKSDQYYATNRLQAGYVMAVFPFGHLKKESSSDKTLERARISGGLRVEHNIQELNSNKTNSGDTVVVNNNITSFLPSVNLAVNFSERMLLRLAYGKSINRPEFREIAPLYFYDFIFNSIYTGNDSLATPSVDNYDLSWEFYPRPGENITFGVFYKKFTNPIEMYFLPMGGTGGTRGFTWGNAPAARNFGAEIEVRKKLDSLPVPVVRNLGVIANAAWIYSVIDLSSGSEESNQRPMMGQSPWVVNAGLFYQDDSLGLQVNVLYNVIGPRVVIVGIPDVPEVYEMPRHQLDLVLVKTFGKNRNIDVRLNITDLLNQETLLMQDANGDNRLDKATDQRMQYFKRGTYYTLGVTFRLFEPKNI